MKFDALRQALLARHLERNDEIELGLVAILAKYHAVLIGPPGTAKSMLTRDLCNAFIGARYFEHLMNKFTTPEELFGPVNIAALEEGRYERVIDGMTPTAHIIFQDEVFKANSAILNAELTLMNERVYKHGSENIEVPLISLFGASNELPEGEELGALFDRFQFRKTVDYIHEPGNFVKMLRTPTKADLPTLSLDDLAAAQEEVSTVEISDAVVETLYDIRADLQMEGVIPSDRRFHQTQAALRAMAWLDGRTQVTDDDFRILQHMLWTTPQETKKVSRVVLTHTNPLDLQADEIIDMVDEIAGNLSAAILDCKQKGLNPKEALLKEGVEWFTKCKSLSDDVKALQKKAEKQGKNTNRISQARDRVMRVAREISRQTIGFDAMEDASNDA